MPNEVFDGMEWQVFLDLITHASDCRAVKNAGFRNSIWNSFLCMILSTTGEQSFAMCNRESCMWELSGRYPWCENMVIASTQVCALAYEMLGGVL